MILPADSVAMRISGKRDQDKFVKAASRLLERCGRSEPARTAIVIVIREEAPETPPTLEDRVRTLPANPRLVLRLLLELLPGLPRWTHPDIPEKILDPKATDRAATRMYWKGCALQQEWTSPDIDRDSKRRAFDRALILLESRGLIRCWGKWAWPTPEFVDFVRTCPDTF